MCIAEINTTISCEQLDMFVKYVLTVSKGNVYYQHNWKIAMNIDILFIHQHVVDKQTIRRI